MNTTWAAVKIGPTAQEMFITAKITFLHVVIHSSNIWLSYIHSRLKK